jgi:hypothetical protein
MINTSIILMTYPLNQNIINRKALLITMKMILRRMIIMIIKIEIRIHMTNIVVFELIDFKISLESLTYF